MSLNNTVRTTRMNKQHFKYAAIWAFVLVGITYLAIIYLEPKRHSESEYVDITMPPPKSLRYLELEKLMEKRGLVSTEMDEYLNLIDKRNKAWSAQPKVSDFLENVSYEKEKQLRKELALRNLNKQEIGAFMAILKSKASHLLNVDE